MPRLMTILPLIPSDNRYGNFLEIGIIDPVKVMRLALRNAVSVVSTLMTTETVIMECTRFINNGRLFARMGGGNP